MEEALLNIVVTINSYLSNYVLIILLIGAGLYFTIRTRADSLLRRRLEARFWRLLALRQKGEERHELLPGAHHRYCGAGRHW